MASSCKRRWGRPDGPSSNSSYLFICFSIGYTENRFNTIGYNINNNTIYSYFTTYPGIKRSMHFFKLWPLIWKLCDNKNIEVKSSTSSQVYNLHINKDFLSIYIFTSELKGVGRENQAPNVITYTILHISFV